MAESKNVTINFGGIGFWVAAILSYLKWHRFWLALGHGFLSWIYVIYYALVYSPLRHYLGL